MMNELSVSRKNLNTIVEAIFHVEGNLIYELEEESCNSQLHKTNISSSDAPSSISSTVMLPSSSYDATSSSSSSSSSTTVQYHHNPTQPVQFQQLQKPPKKRKYTTDDITQMLPHVDSNTSDVNVQTHIPPSLSPQHSSNNQFISEYYKASKANLIVTPISTNDQQDSRFLTSDHVSKATVCYIDIAHFLKNNNSNMTNLSEFPIMITNNSASNTDTSNNNNNISTNTINNNSNDENKNVNGETLISVLVSTT